ncbi:MAG: PaaI family thioesterase [Gemmatales bacterium]
MTALPCPHSKEGMLPDASASRKTLRHGTVDFIIIKEENGIISEFKRMNDAVNTSFERRVRDSFARQKVMETLGAVMSRVDEGMVEITLPYRVELTQQHGFLHAGIVATILDSACGYAAFSLMPADVAVLTVEYKINLMRPAKGERFVARARVVRPGKTVTVSRAMSLPTLAVRRVSSPPCWRRSWLFPSGTT